MTRNKFFASVFGALGVARAQQWKECTSGTPGTTSYVTPNPDMRCWAQYKKAEPALNNQCPVCGTMAEPLKKYKLGVKNCKPVGDGYTLSCEDIWATPDPQVVRCKLCNAAFWQDAQ